MAHAKTQALLLDIKALTPQDRDIDVEISPPATNGAGRFKCTSCGLVQCASPHGEYAGGPPFVICRGCSTEWTIQISYQEK
jgi:hypothetical protein